MKPICRSGLHLGPRPPEQHLARPRTPTERAHDRPKGGSHERGRGKT